MADVPFIDQEDLPDTSYDPRGEVNHYSYDNRIGDFDVTSECRVQLDRQSSPQELIIAVFVVHFDTRKGDVR